MQETNRRALRMTLPVLPLRGIMVFPHMVMHFDVGRPKSVAALEKAMMEDQRIFLVTQRDAEVDDPRNSDLYRVGAQCAPHAGRSRGAGGAGAHHPPVL